jgi:hypothetical protein
MLISAGDLHQRTYLRNLRKKKNPTWTQCFFCQFCDLAKEAIKAQEELAKFDYKLNVFG